jgi:hypothetical protein
VSGARIDFFVSLDIIKEYKISNIGFEIVNILRRLPFR